MKLQEVCGCDMEEEESSTKYVTCKCGHEIERPGRKDLHDLKCPICKRTGTFVPSED